MTRAIILRRLAERDLADARGWYDKQVPGLGAAFLDEIDAAIERIAASALEDS